MPRVAPKKPRAAKTAKRRAPSIAARARRIEDGIAEIGRKVAALASGARPVAGHSAELHRRALEGAEAAVAHYLALDLLRNRESGKTPGARVQRAVVLLNKARGYVDNPIPGETDERILARTRELVTVASVARTYAKGESKSGRADAIKSIPVERWERAISLWRGELPSPGGKPKLGVERYRWDVVVLELLTGSSDKRDAKQMRDDHAKWRKERSA